ncbi:hypothetical protein CMQ_1139 [Grosmannia clavigera kw1407]|uniref:Mg2+ transporter zinc transport protein n=1 Tax=Grosmannia clavigera (strain kw1407 / UAMH 11150) TaxID=655863 RepID=F0XDT2_GROCL|nr:uncharacterized protein CMQ_1139 [Grosmannia clavigera kw1407]EFX04211.1 hypothetical protein CMQ_1139 [Grosmannia clavigera kw1407]
MTKIEISATKTAYLDGLYLRYVKELSGQWPRLKYLADFMQVGTAPKREEHMNNMEKAERRERTKVAVLNFSNPESMTSTNCNSPSELAASLDKYLYDSENMKTSVLFLVEDLSTSVMEQLGKALDVDPTFFRNHLEDHTWFNIKDNWVDLPELGSQSQGRKFVTLRYMTTQFFEDEALAEEAKAETVNWNVLRRVDLESQVKSGDLAWWAESRHRVGILRPRMSIWSTWSGSSWVGIVLVDPCVSVGRPLWNGYGNMHHPPSMAESGSVEKRAQNLSTFDTVLARLLSIPKNDRDRLQNEPEHLVSHLYPFVFGGTLVTLEFAFTGLIQVEWELDSGHGRTPEDLERLVEALHKWRRRLFFHTRWVQESIKALEGCYSLGPLSAAAKSKYAFIQSQSTGSWQDGLRQDFLDILSRLQLIQERAESTMQMAITNVSIEEGKISLIESGDTSRITSLAFVFLPMSLVASVLGMNEEFKWNAHIFIVFIVTSVTLTVVSLGLAMHSRSIMSYWRQNRFVIIGRKEN